MSETGKTQDKSDNDLSYSDLTKLFEISKVERLEDYGGKITNFGKNFFDYKKVNLEREKSEEPEASTPTSYSYETDSESELSANACVSEKSSNYSRKSKKSELKDELKLLYQCTTFNWDSKCNSDEKSFSSDEKSYEHCLAMQGMLTGLNSVDNKVSNYGKRTSKDSFLSGLCAQLSMSSGCRKDILKILAKEHSIFEVIDLDDCMASWNHKIQSHKMTLDKRLSRDLDDHMNSSILICFGRIHFRCHRFILRTCRLFRKWQEKRYVFKPEQQLTALAFSVFYQFAMGNKPKIPSHLFVEVRNIAQILDVPELEMHCMKLLDSDLYQENEAFEVLKTAKRHNSPQLQRLVMQRIFKFFLPLVASNDFIEMDLDDVCSLLECHTIGVNSEIEVFFAAILWLNSKWKDRNEIVVSRVMSCVRYALIPPWFTYSLKKSTGIQDVDRVIKQRSVSKMIENGASIAATISLFFLDSTKFESMLKSLQMKIPKQRHWIYDRNCTYHYGAHESVSEAVDYVVFKDYLKVLQMEGENYWRNFQDGKEVHFAKIFCQKFLDTAWSKVRF